MKWKNKLLWQHHIIHLRESVNLCHVKCMTCACFTIFTSCWICHFLSQHWPWPSMSSEEFCGQLWNRVPLILKLAQHHLWWWHSSTSSTGRTGRTSSGGGEHIKSKRTGGSTKGNPGQMPWSTKFETESYLLLQHNHYSTISPRWHSIDCNWDFLALEIVQVCAHFVSCNKSLIFYRCVFYFLSDWIDCYLLVCV